MSNSASADRFLSQRPEYDAILIPGGGLTNDGQPTPWHCERLDRASELYTELGGLILMPLSAGTTHKPPPLDKSGFPIYESIAAAQYLMDEHDVLPEHLMPESLSVDTIGNAAFSRWLLTDPDPDIRKLHIITSEFHMPRTRRIFEWIYSLPPISSDNYTLTFEAVPNIGLADNDLNARVEKEKMGLKSVESLSHTIRNLKSLRKWLSTEHSAYAMTKNRDTETGPEISSEALNTY